MNSFKRVSVAFAITVVSVTQASAIIANAKGELDLQVLNQGSGLVISFTETQVASDPVFFPQGYSFNYAYTIDSGTPALSFQSIALGMAFSEAPNTGGSGSSEAHMYLSVVNNLDVPQSVEFSVYGSAIAEAFPSLELNEPGRAIADASAKLYDFETQSWVCDFEAHGKADYPPHGRGGSESNQFDYAITVAPGATYELSANVYASQSVLSTPGPAAFAPFALGLIGFARRRRKMASTH